MRYQTSDCRDCNLPCTHESCPYYRTEHFKCDFCNVEDVKLYDYNGYEICESCLLKEFPIIEGTDDF